MKMSQSSPSKDNRANNRKPPRPVEPGLPGLSPSIIPKILDHTRCLSRGSTRRNRSRSDFEIETFAHLSTPSNHEFPIQATTRRARRHLRRRDPDLQFPVQGTDRPSGVGASTQTVERPCRRRDFARGDGLSGGQGSRPSFHPSRNLLDGTKNAVATGHSP